MYLEASLSQPGPPVPDVHLDEMSEWDLRHLMTYIYGAARKAIQDDVDNVTTQILIDWYDELVMRLAEVSPSFVDAWRRGAISPPQGWKYRKDYLAKLGLLSAS